MQLIRRPRGSSTAAPFTKPSTKWLMVVPMVPPCRYSSVRTPDTNVNDPLSAMKGSAARTRLIWPIPLNLIEFAHCSSVLSSRAPKDTSPLRQRRRRAARLQHALPGHHGLLGPDGDGWLGS